MNHNSCNSLLTVLSDIAESLPYCRALSTILSEPNIPSVLKALGIKEIECSDKLSQISPPLSIARSLVLRGLSGDEITLRQSSQEGALIADLPLLHPPRTYRGPLYSYMRGILSKLANELGAEKPPLVTDAFIPGIKRLCRPKLGCMPKKQYEHLDEKISIETLYPRVYWPTILGWARVRLRSQEEFLSPFICIGRRDHYLNILCVEERCRFSISREGVIKVIEGDAIYSQGTRCNKTKLYIDYLIGNSYSEEFEVKRPALWSPTLAIPLGISKTENMFELCIWNPYTFPKLHEVVIEDYRVQNAYIYSSSTDEWERLEPNYNRVNVGIPGLGLARLRLVLRKLPPLLRKR